MASRLSFAGRPALAAVAAAAALMMAPALGADAPKGAPAEKAQPASTSKAKNRANVMSRDELRVCMSEQERLQKITAGMKAEQADLARLKAEAQRIDAELTSRIGTVDPNDTATIEALKAQGVRRDAMADEFNTRLAALREQSAAYDSGRKAWVERCDNRDFDEYDEAVIRLEQKRAAGKK